MRCFTGIVPPENIYNTVLGIQNQYGDNRLEPHITVTPPTTVLQQEDWIKAIELVGSKFSPFTISLPKTGEFGKRVLFIDVMSGELTSLHDALQTVLQPYEQPGKHDQKNQKYNPHLTLGRNWCGFTKEHFAAMKELAEAYLQKEPVSFNASFLRVYNKASPGGRYQLLKDVPFTVMDE